MAIKTFNELVKVELKGKTSKKPVFKKAASGKLEKCGELDYLSWADCLTSLYENGAEKVIYGNVHNKDDHPLFLLNGSNPFVRVFVEVDGDRRELDFPVIDGSKDIKMDYLAQSDVHNATQRAFVKCVAINWGLGLSLWMKEEKSVEDAKSPGDDIYFHNALAIKSRIEQLVTIKLQNGKTMDEIYSVLDDGCGAAKAEKRYAMILNALLSSVGLEQKLRSL